MRVAILGKRTDAPSLSLTLRLGPGRVLLMVWFTRLVGALTGKQPNRREGEVLCVSGLTGTVMTTDMQALEFRIDECQGFVPKERQRVSIQRVDGMIAKGLVLLIDVPATAVLTDQRAQPTVAAPRTRATLDWVAIEACFGATLGPLLRALVELCFHRDPESPADAMRHVSLLLDWIPPGTMGVEDRRVHQMTPQAVWPFAATGSDLEHFGVLSKEGDTRAFEDRPVVFVARGARARVVAPDLASFIGLVAWTGWPQLERDMTDHQFAELRAAQLADEDTRACMESLLTLPGVGIPRSPMRLIRRTSDVWFEDVAGARPTTWPRPKDTYDALRVGYLRLKEGDALGALDAVATLSGADAIAATRIRWNALYDLGRLDVLRDDIERNVASLTHAVIPGGQAAHEDLAFLLDESQAVISTAARDALARACNLNTQT